MRGLKELRVKESDRLAATAAMLRVNGVEVEIDDDDLIVHGKGRAPGGGVVATHMDHRLAMSALVMGLGSEQPVGVDDAAFIATSFPGFAELMRAPGRRPFMIIAIDGPAASGKGTLAQEARRALWLSPSRHRAALSRGGDGAARCRPPANDERDKAIAAAKTIDPAKFDETALKRYDVGEAASVVSAIPEVRAALFKLPAGLRRGAARRGARRPRHRHRDLPRCRGEDLRHRKSAGAGASPDPGTAREGRKGRRSRGSGGYSGPRRARPVARRGAPDAGQDAHLLDTSALDIEGSFKAALALVERPRARPSASPCPSSYLRLYPRPSGPPHSSMWSPERAEGAVHRPSRLEDQAPLRAPSRRAGP